MKLPRPSIPLFLILLFLSVAACVPITPDTGGIGSSHPGGEIGAPDSGGAIGTLRVSGPNVWLNNSPATDGAPVYLGNSVATGAGSSAKVEFADGGFLQLDENTDPLFEWLEQSKCLLIRIVKGQVYLKKSQTCVEGPDISMILNSEVNVNIPPPPAPTEVTVIRGTADIKLPTRQIKLVQGQQLTATVRAPEVKTLSPDVVRSLSKWKTDYRFRPLRVTPDRVKPDGIKPDRIKPDRVRPVPVIPERVTPAPVTPDAVSPDPVKPESVKPDRLKPAPLASDPVTTTPETEPTLQSPVLDRRPLKRTILSPKSTPVPVNEQPAPELR